MDMIEKTKLNTAYGMFAQCPYRIVVKETMKIDSTGNIVEVTIKSEVTIPNGNNIKK